MTHNGDRVSSGSIHRIHEVEAGSGNDAVSTIRTEVGLRTRDLGVAQWEMGFDSAHVVIHFALSRTLFRI